MTWKILQGDCRAMLATLPEASVQTCVTSPPYWGLRDYGVDGQLGLEATLVEYVEAVVGVFRDVRRVLRDDGTLWINLGDAYVRAADKWKNRAGTGLRPKNLIGTPWRIAFGLQADGWYLRSDIIWDKPNPMPEPVSDRPTQAHEYLFLLTKSDKYYYDIDSIREPSQARKYPSWEERKQRGAASRRGDPGLSGDVNRGAGMGVNPLGRNRRTVWTVTPKPFKGAHFATMPPDLVEPCILAGSRVGDMVLDPFSGAGTTGLVATQLRRSYTGIELNPEYVEMSRRRIDENKERAA